MKASRAGKQARSVAVGDSAVDSVDPKMLGNSGFALALVCALAIRTADSSSAKIGEGASASVGWFFFVYCGTIEWKCYA